MTNTLEGPNPDEMKAGELYMVVDNGETQIGETVLALEKIGEASEESEDGKIKLVIELPQNAHSVLRELSEIRGMTAEEGGREMIYALMESDLIGGTGDIGGSLGMYLGKKYSYDPEGWRKEVS